MNWRKHLCVGLTIFFMGLMINTAQAQNAEKNIGLGVIVGEPTGISLKVWTSATTAFDAGLAWSLEGRNAFHIHADYLWHNFEVLGDDIEPGQLPLYYGIGGRIVLVDNDPNPNDDNDVIIGVRVPVGINYLFEDNPIGLFLEVAPIVNLVPSTDLDIDAALGARFYF